MPIVFKCKMCGGDLDIQEGATIVKCLYCGSKQTLPKIDDDKRRSLYSRANYFRQNGDFDKAVKIYEQILSEDNTDAETYWSIVLCRYGVEYVEDPATHSRVPTVNRIQSVPVTSDADYNMALKYADVSQYAIYQAEAKAIDKIQHDMLEISRREKPFDVFISYKDSDNNGQRTIDSVLAVDLYEKLTQEGFKVFCSRITLEDKIGQKYEPYIFAALSSAPVMIALGTRPEYFNAVWVRNEWSRYLNMIHSGAKKTLIPAFRDMSPYELPEEFSHLQAQDMSKIGFMQDLIRGVRKLIRPETPKAETVIVNGGTTNAAPLLKRAFMFLEDGDFANAETYCERVLDLDPENGEAYLGKLLVEKRLRHREDLAELPQPFDRENNYQKAVRYGNAELVAELKGYIAAIKDRIEEARRRAEEQARIEAQRRAEEARIEAERKAEKARIDAQRKSEWERFKAQREAEQAEQAKKRRKRNIILSAVAAVIIIPLCYFMYINSSFMDICRNGTEQEIINAISGMVNTNEALRITAGRGKTEAMKALINAGADVNAKDNDDETALMWAAESGHAEAVKILINTGANVNAKNNDGYTALMLAAINGNAETIKILLNAGADVNAKNNNGGTALILAAYRGHAEAITTLLNAGADVNAKTDGGTRAVDYARININLKGTDALRLLEERSW